MASKAVQAMETLSVRVTGFQAAGSVTTYTTEVTVAHQKPWSVAIRYSAFHACYSSVVDSDRRFVFDFPKKGNIFSSPTPQERKPRLDAFVQALVQHTRKQGSPHALVALLDELLEISQHVVEIKKPEPEVEVTQHVEAAEPEPETEAQAKAEATIESAAEPVQEPEAETTIESAAEPVQEPEAEQAVEASVEPVNQSDAVEDIIAEPAKEAEPVQEPAEKAESAPVSEADSTPVTVVVAAEPTPDVEVEEKKAEDAVVEPTPEAVDVEQPEKTADSVVDVAVDATIVAEDPVVETATPEVVAAPETEEPAIPVRTERRISCADKRTMKVASVTTSKNAAGQDVKEITYSNGMTLKKKVLTADQKRQRNLRRREKRKKKSNMKIRGGKAAPHDGMTSEESDSEL
ncbi:hypothetical protein ATCC90586_005652 [Pythium insidiosum]|nr:hypothetical protein ATCC90586_005652 [Pythium insidiosum]